MSFIVRRITLLVVIAITAVSFTVSTAARFGGLQAGMQEALDDKPFLENERIRLREVVLVAAVNTPADRAEDLAQEAQSLYDRKKYVDAAKIYRQAAEQGDAAAQARLGWMHVTGEGMAKDYEKAVKWFRQAAEQGEAGAQANLGWMYAKGKGVATDYSEAVKWFRKAVEQDNAKAQSGLAWIYATSPIPKYWNAPMAVAYAQQAVSKGPESWKLVNTLAAAYARNGEFDKAVMTQQKAIRLLQSFTGYDARKKQQRLEESQMRLERYRQRQPYISLKGH